MSHCGTVNTSVGTNFYIVFQLHNSYLWNLFIAICSRSKTKSVGTDYGSGVKNTIVPNSAILIDGYMRINNGVHAYFHIASDGSLRMYTYIVSNFSPVFDARKWTDVHILSNFGTFCNGC